MTSLQTPTTFDQPRPMSQQAFHHHASPADSPRQGLVRPASQASLHLAPVATTANFAPAIHSSGHDNGNGPLTSFPGHFRPFTPSMTLPMPIPDTNFNPYPPPTAPPLSYFPTSTPMYETKNGSGNGQDMMRTYSHAHPMHSAHSATDKTASTRYSPSPYSAGGLQNSPPSASVHHSYNMSSIQPQPTIQISADQSRGHINPSLFNSSGHYSNNNTNYPMSRSTSGASASDAGNEMGRLLTPHYHDQQQIQDRDHLSPHDDMRKVSDPMMNLGISKNRLYPASYASAYEANGGHGLGLGSHPQPQPTELYWRTNNNHHQAQGQQQQYGVGDHYALSSARGDVKPDLMMMNEDTEYERERQQQIMDNRRIMESVGLGQTVSSLIVLL